MDANAFAVFNELMGWYQRQLKLNYSKCAFGKQSELHGWSAQKKNSFNPAHDGMSCYEILMHGALCADKFAPSQIKDAFDSASKASDGKPFKYDAALQAQLMKGNGRSYSLSNHNPLPEAGDLVFFNRMMHVAMATGVRVAGSSLPNRKGVNVSYTAKGVNIGGDVDAQEAQVLSFWPRYVVSPTEDKTGFTSKQEQVDAACALELTTIEDLVLGMAIEIKGSPTIDYGSYNVMYCRPVWGASGYV